MNDFQLNDWVYSYLDGEKYIQITDVDQYYSILKGYDDGIQPIPLTEEILALNDFKDYTEIREFQFEEDGEKYRFYLKKMYDKVDNIFYLNKMNDKVKKISCWGTNIGGVLPSLITYVHELQHALRLAGLKQLADNFKVV